MRNEMPHRYSLIAHSSFLMVHFSFSHVLNGAHPIGARTSTKYATSTAAITYISHFTSRFWPAISLITG